MAEQQKMKIRIVIRAPSGEIHEPEDDARLQLTLGHEEPERSPERAAPSRPPLILTLSVLTLTLVAAAGAWYLWPFPGQATAPLTVSDAPVSVSNAEPAVDPLATQATAPRASSAPPATGDPASAPEPESAMEEASQLVSLASTGAGQGSASPVPVGDAAEAVPLAATAGSEDARPAAANAGGTSDDRVAANTVASLAPPEPDAPPTLGDQAPTQTASRPALEAASPETARRSAPVDPEDSTAAADGAAANAGSSPPSGRADTVMPGSAASVVSIDPQHLAAGGAPHPGQAQVGAVEIDVTDSSVRASANAPPVAADSVAAELSASTNQSAFDDAAPTPVVAVESAATSEFAGSEPDAEPTWSGATGDDPQPDGLETEVAVATPASPSGQDSPLDMSDRVLSDAVTRAQLSNGIYQREPTDAANATVTVPGPGSRKIYYFTELRGLGGQSVRHRWIYDGQTVASLEFRVGGDRWRVYSSKNLSTRMVGEWRVVAEDADGHLISETRFQVVTDSTSG